MEGKDEGQHEEWEELVSFQWWCSDACQRPPPPKNPLHPVHKENRQGMCVCVCVCASQSELKTAKTLKCDSSQRITSLPLRLHSDCFYETEP